MLPDINKIRGIHPGAILSRELKSRGLESKKFALSMGEFPQKINAISKGKRGINPLLSIKLGKAFGIDESYFMILQAYYEIEKARKQQLHQKTTPDLNKIRPVVFWDTNIDMIDWDKQKSAIIKRIFERGNQAERNEIMAFYGHEIISEELKKNSSNFNSYNKNAKDFFDRYINHKK